MKFEVGQKWITRDGSIVEITSINQSFPYTIEFQKIKGDAFPFSCDGTGNFFHYGTRELGLDLIKRLDDIDDCIMEILIS